MDSLELSYPKEKEKSPGPNHDDDSDRTTVHLE